MRLRRTYLWEVLVSSYWFTPALFLVGAIGLHALTISLDRQPGYALDEIAWVYGGGSEGARGLLAAVAGSIITVIGVTFSIIISVMAQASSQFGPRILRNFMRDTANQVVLGILVATFVYCLLALRTVRAGDEQGGSFVPNLSVTVGVALAIVSVAGLVYFIHHVSASLQAPNVVAAVGQDLVEAIDRIFPSGIGQDASHRDPTPPTVSNGRDGKPHLDKYARAVCAKDSGYLQGIEAGGILEHARQADVVIEFLARPGHFILRNTPLARVSPADRCSDRLCDEILSAFVLGPQRTPIQDIEFAVDQLVEIAVRSLSPGINDPFTAIQCIDWLASGIRQVMDADFPSPFRYDDAGALRLIAPTSTFEGIVDGAFNQIRQYGHTSVSVSIHLLDALIVIVPQARHFEHLDILIRHARLTATQALAATTSEQDRHDIQDRLSRILAIESDKRSHAAGEPLSPDAQQTLAHRHHASLQTRPR